MEGSGPLVAAVIVAVEVDMVRAEESVVDKDAAVDELDAVRVVVVSDGAEPREDVVDWADAEGSSVDDGTVEEVSKDEQTRSAEAVGAWLSKVVALLHGATGLHDVWPAWHQ